MDGCPQQWLGDMGTEQRCKDIRDRADIEYYAEKQDRSRNMGSGPDQRSKRLSANICYIRGTARKRLGFVGPHRCQNFDIVGQGDLIEFQPGTRICQS
jgi:hypothetical protein